MTTSNIRLELAQRYENAIQLAERWLKNQGRPRSFLADRIRVNRSVLTRFLNRTELYTPDPTRPRMMEVLEAIERTCAEQKRDVFLSHRSTDKDLVRVLAAAIESTPYHDRTLLTWLDEAEIRPGQSIPGMVNDGLERSRFVALVMTPDYFQGGSGWTDAEWHAALHNDPDNRTARLVPILAADCPYIPPLLRHLNAIDIRGNRYEQGLQQLLSVLKDEPLPRPITYRGQLVTPTGNIARSTLISERAVPQADPDPITERLYCNLLPVEQIPTYVYSAPVLELHKRLKSDGTKAMPAKSALKDIIRQAQITNGVEHPFMPAFRVDGDRIVTFHDLESPDSPFASVVAEDAVDVARTADLLRDENDRRLVMSLLNMAIVRHASRVGLSIDETRQGRFFFPPKDGGPNVRWWIARNRKAPRTVAKPCPQEGGRSFWRHQAAYLVMVFLANKLYLSIKPTWVITTDGHQIATGPKVGRLVIRWTGPERNLQILYHIRFWTSVLRRGPGPISIRAGDQSLNIATIPAFVQQAYGIASDQRDLLGLLDKEASLIAEREDQIADLAIEAGQLQEFDSSDDEFLDADWSDEEETAHE